MADVLRIVDKFVITGIGTVYMVKHSKDAIIRVGDIFYDLRGNKFAVKGIEMFRRKILADVDIENMPVGLLFDVVDGVEVHGNLLVGDISEISFLFCNHPLYIRKVDVDYEEEYCEAMKNHRSVTENLRYEIHYRRN